MFAASKSGSVDAKDAQFKNVTMLLHGNGTNGAQNNTFLDSSTNNFSITRNGNTTQGTFTPYGANWSNYFNGSSYLQVSSNSALNMNTYCCLEAWVCYSSLSTNTLIIGRDSSYWLGYDFSGIGGAATKLVFGIYNGSSWQAVSSSTTPVVGVWYHVVGIKDNTTLRIYINGTQENTATFSGTPATGATPFGIASNQNTQNMTGYISNGRLVLGSSASVLPYTSNFTSSNTPLTAVSGTALLTCQSNKFVDNSTNAFTVSPNGSPSVQRFSPFSPTTAYSTSVIGGSGYFDGSGDYLTAAQNAAFNLGTGAFTVEAWINLSALPSPSNGGIITLGNGASGSGPNYCGWGLWVMTNGTINFERYDGTETVRQTSTAITLNQWNHIVAVRDGSSNFAIFINGVRGYSAASATTSYNNVNTDLLYVGRTISGAGPSTNYLNGYIGDVRVVAGTAVYSATSTTLTVPTAPLTAVSNTQFLLSTTNAGILDNAMMNDLETVGNAQISTSVKKYGTGSLAFDGTGDWLQAVSTPQADFGSGNFTLECWAYLNNFSTDYRLMAKVVNISSYGSWQVLVDTSGYPRFYASSAASSWDVANGTGGGIAISTSTWAHIAVTRSGSTITMWVNGVSAGTSTSSASLYYSASVPVTVGGMPDGTRSLNGYIDDLRITKGVARYTTTFTPPTAAFPNN